MLNSHPACVCVRVCVCVRADQVGEKSEREKEETRVADNDARNSSDTLVSRERRVKSAACSNAPRAVKAGERSLGYLDTLLTSHRARCNTPCPGTRVTHEDRTKSEENAREPRARDAACGDVPLVPILFSGPFCGTSSPPSLSLSFSPLLLLPLCASSSPLLLARRHCLLHSRFCDPLCLANPLRDFSACSLAAEPDSSRYTSLDGAQLLDDGVALSASDSDSRLVVLSLPRWRRRSLGGADTSVEPVDRTSHPSNRHIAAPAPTNRRSFAVSRRTLG